MTQKTHAWTMVALAVASGLILSACTVPVGEKPCSDGAIFELRARYPRLAFDDGGVALARLGELGEVYHPQTAMLFVIDTLENRPLDDTDSCAVANTGRWLRDSLVKSGDGWYWTYGFDWRYSDRADLLSKAPWVSGLAQGNGLVALLALADWTGDDSYRQAADKALTAFVATDSRLVTKLGSDAAWYQEYETETPTFVLNGHLDALIGLAFYANQTGSAEAETAFQFGVTALRRLLPMFEVELPDGIASAYDLIRINDQLDVRAVSGSGTAYVESSGGSRLSDAIVTHDRDRNAEYLLNGDFEELDVEDASMPANWRRWVSSSEQSAITARTADDAASGSRYLRITTSGLGWEAAGQRIEAGGLPAGEYVLTFQARLTTNPPTTPGRATVIAECPGGAQILAEEFAVRSPDWTSYGVEFEVPDASCGVLVELYQLSSVTADAVIDFDAASLHPREPSASLTLPGSVWETPELWIGITGEADGMEIRFRGSWIEIGASRSLIPDYLQGRNIHFGYHEGHITQLAKISELTGDTFFEDFAERWLPLATTLDH